MPIAMPMSPISGPDNDPLANGPPRPPLRTATRPPGRPAGDAPFQGSALSDALTGNPTMLVMKNMMAIEKLIAEVAKVVPQLATIFAPAISQARDLAGAGLGNLAQGGMGAPPQDTGAPPPAAMGGGAPPMPPPPVQ